MTLITSISKSSSGPASCLVCELSFSRLHEVSCPPRLSLQSILSDDQYHTFPCSKLGTGHDLHGFETKSLRLLWQFQMLAHLGFCSWFAVLLFPSFFLAVRSKWSPRWSGDTTRSASLSFLPWSTSVELASPTPSSRLYLVWRVDSFARRRIPISSLVVGPK